MNFAGAYSLINMRYLFQGFLVTLGVSAVSIVLSFIIGLILGIIRYSRIKWVSGIVGFIIDVIRNLPLLLILFFTYFGLPAIGIRVGSVSASITALVVFESAMISEIVRAGIESIDYGQMEGARSNGMTYVQAMYHIIVPQAVHNMIPALLSQFVSLVKDTSLATIILLPELLYRAQIIYSQNSTYMIPMYLIIAVMYFIICFALSKLASYLSKRYAS
ncbi:amino acid ABC transporter permease [Lactobacillus corticis]|uniref:Glutamine ABC transporter permease protein n=9 Tax=Lactobacillus corticis TaxID=2201249 RepID=A0A916QKS0_9LACO|nr:amino acid ABC transporter permease [Lactobacillus corticis]GFZ27783.1 glutamine ABC transporter permease protein [Lactobacillus corticis]